MIARVIGVVCCLVVMLIGPMNGYAHGDRVANFRDFLALNDGFGLNSEPQSMGMLENIVVEDNSKDGWNGSSIIGVLGDEIQTGEVAFQHGRSVSSRLNHDVGGWTGRGNDHIRAGTRQYGGLPPRVNNDIDISRWRLPLVDSSDQKILRRTIYRAFKHWDYLNLNGQISPRLSLTYAAGFSYSIIGGSYGLASLQKGFSQPLGGKDSSNGHHYREDSHDVLSDTLLPRVELRPAGYRWIDILWITFLVMPIVVITWCANSRIILGRYPWDKGEKLSRKKRARD